MGRGVVAAVSGLVVGVGCSGPGELAWRDLGRDEIRCEVLTESGRLVRPGEPGRSRWVRGWRCRQLEGRFAAVTTARAAVAEVARLDTAARRLRVTPADDLDLTLGATIQAGDGAAVALDGPGLWDVPIARGGRPGVLPIRLVVAEGGVLALRQIRLLAPRPAGTVHIRNGTIEQTGWSMARWTLPVAPGMQLEGSTPTTRTRHRSSSSDAT